MGLALEPRSEVLEILDQDPLGAEQSDGLRVAIERELEEAVTDEEDLDADIGRRIRSALNAGQFDLAEVGSEGRMRRRFEWPEDVGFVDFNRTINARLHNQSPIPN